MRRRRPQKGGKHLEARNLRVRLLKTEGSPVKNHTTNFVSIGVGPPCDLTEDLTYGSIDSSDVHRPFLRTAFTSVPLSRALVVPPRLNEWGDKGRKPASWQILLTFEAAALGTICGLPSARACIHESVSAGIWPLPYRIAPLGQCRLWIRGFLDQFSTSENKSSAPAY